MNPNLFLSFKIGNDPDNPDWFEGREEWHVLLGVNDWDILERWLKVGHYREYAKYPGKEMRRAWVKTDGNTIGDLFVDTALNTGSAGIVGNLSRGLTKIVSDNAEEGVFGTYVAELKEGVTNDRLCEES